MMNGGRIKFVLGYTDKNVLQHCVFQLVLHSGCTPVFASYIPSVSCRSCHTEYKGIQNIIKYIYNYRIHLNKRPCPKKINPPHISQVIELIFLHMPVFKASFYRVLLLRYWHFKFWKCEKQAYLRNKKW